MSKPSESLRAVEVRAIVTLENGEAVVHLMHDFGRQVGETIPLKNKDGVIRIVPPEGPPPLTDSPTSNGHGII